MVIKRATSLAKQATQFATGVAAQAVRDGVSKTASKLAMDAATNMASRMVGEQVDKLSKKISPKRLAEDRADLSREALEIVEMQHGALVRFGAFFKSMLRQEKPSYKAQLAVRDLLERPTASGAQHNTCAPL